MSPITTHILDTAVGKPAAGVPVSLSLMTNDGWQIAGEGVTNSDGRITDLLPAGSLRAGTYRIVFETGSYFEASGQTGFYPFVPVVFVVTDADQHYHVPLLLNPYGYSTYRGS